MSTVLRPRTLGILVVGVVCGCLYGLHARSAAAPTVADHLWMRLTDPRPWVSVILPASLVVAVSDGVWHGSPAARMRHGTDRSLTRALFLDALTASCAALGGYLLGAAASATGLPWESLPQAAPTLAACLMTLAAATTLLSTAVAGAAAWRAAAGWALCCAVVLWAVCQIGLGIPALGVGPVDLALPGPEAGRVRSLASLLACAALAVAVQRGPLRPTSAFWTTTAAAGLWTLAAPALQGNGWHSSGEVLLLTWWGHGGGAFDAQVFTVHWMVTNLPVLMALLALDTPALRSAPLRVLAHGRTWPVLKPSVTAPAVAVVGATACTTVIATVMTGEQLSSSLLLGGHLLLGWLLHVLVWGTLTVSVTWVAGDQNWGLIVLSSTLLLAPLAPWESSHLPLGLTALAQDAGASPAWLWLAAPVAALALTIRCSPLPRQGRDL
ncbi:hypothetical protein [Kytococcus schroeteri]|uniref:hypothetical protein n=1 Tax=Kytococcus schroeteri TaxID=138300 RepID=UPI0011819DE0|nr:hypothetical protein [Kytococcus schroeteri]